MWAGGTMQADEAMYRLLFEASPMPSWIADYETGRFLVVNDAAIRQYGYTRAELLAMTVDALQLPEEAPALRHALRGRMSAPFIIDGAWHHRRHDGSISRVQLRAVRVIFAGAPAVLTLVLDHRRTDAVADLAHAEAHLETAQELAQVGSWDFDAASGTTTWSRELYRLYGAPLSVEASLEEFLVRLHPDDHERVRNALSDATEQRLATFEFEFRMLPGDGEERTLFARHRASYDADGAPLHLSGTVQDVTKRHHAEQALAVSERHHRMLIENSTDLVTTTDATGVITYMSPSVMRVLGYSAEEMVGKSAMDFVHPDDLALAGATLEMSFANPGSPSSLEFRFRAPDGTFRVLESTGQAYVGDEGVMTLVVNARDVSERYEATERQRKLVEDLAIAREAAEAATVAKSAFLATMSHEIRTPLNGVLGLTEIVLASALTAEQRRYLQMVRDSGDVLLTLLNDILDLSKIEAEHLELESIPVALPDLVHVAVGLFTASAHAHGLETRVSIAEDVPKFVRGDPTRLRQVLANLIGNAIKFTTEGTVEADVAVVGTTDGVATVRFAVRDTGIGIPADKLDTVFSEFSQVDSSTTHEYGGTGLGLSISRRLVQLMGGELTVTSEVGKGSEFSFTIALPIETAPEEVAVTAPVRLTGLRALVVDGVASDRQLVRDILAPLGAVVTEAASGASALAALERALAEQLPFAVVLLDPQLHGSEGIGLANEIRARPELSTTRILMLSSAEGRSDALRLMPPGTAGFLLKPVSRAELVEAAASLVGPRPLSLSSGTAAGALLAQTAPKGLPARVGLRILLAEDNLVNQEVATAMLRARGDEVTVVGDGAQAVAAAAAGGFDLVLMDIHMPRMDGLAATTAIRLLPEAGTLPVIALTAYSSASERDRCLAAGMNDYLTKPFTARALFAVIDGVGARSAEPVAHAVDARPDSPPADIRGFRATMRDAGAEDAVDGILDSFLADAPKRAGGVAAAIEAQDAELIRSEAHAFRSAAASIGAHALAAHLLAVELAGRDGRIADARSLAASVRDDALAVIAYVHEARTGTVGP